MRYLLALLLLTAVGKPTLNVRVFPQVSVVNLSQGCTTVLLTAELAGEESEKWYCPKVTWEFPDGTQATEESDCAPFEERDEYPRIWRRRLCAPAHPQGEAWIVYVSLSKKDVIARQEIRFFVK